MGFVHDWFSPGAELSGQVWEWRALWWVCGLGSGMEGLLHISELSHDGEETYPIYQRYRFGDTVAVRVLNIVPQEHRIALGLPELSV
jgi:ribosomal protein S1